ncbi:hypothetical protein RHSIM_Rhsim04G0176100 [Rhododendron simsii]|uniref:CCD97-like C-terminal domain-containing protein n=1 Tax=Rhododendron simsii TaxID=118357 RepID=A0A834LQJ9_RHOSS|nr:hypothetical protein RHSIM_Rhsim04G0176100 [Rhododendron simsii]
MASRDELAKQDKPLSDRGPLLELVVFHVMFNFCFPEMFISQYTEVVALPMKYGSKLTFEELKEFDIMTDDYEINWHLNHLRPLISPTMEELRSRSKKTKNRRRAYMDKLICDGQYFSEDAMREREPYLHHEYVGQFQDMSERSMPRPGERLSETLMRWSEESILVEKIRREQQRLGVQGDWVGNQTKEEEEEEGEEEEEVEEAEEGEKEDDKFGVANESSHPLQIPSDNHDASDCDQSTTERHSEGATLSAEEMQDRMDQFTYIMQEKFMSGEDHQHLDYSKIDEDETLDDHWQREASQDAEEKYFDDV